MPNILALLVRLLGWLLAAVLLGRPFYLLGWPLVKLTTLGRYPDPTRDSHSRQDIYVECVEAGTAALLMMAALGQFA